jgi:excinuclease ABC subunit C
MQISERIRQKLDELPDKPGCYLMRDRRGKIVYVGKARSLRKRVQSYFRDATLRKADPKLRGLIKSVADIEHVVTRTEAAAALTEGQLIKDYRPKYNVSFRDDKRFLLLRADRSQPFPRLRLCRIKRKDTALYFGPYASSTAARATLDFVEKRFHLRKCTPRIPDTEAYRHCINDIIRHCSAPCVGKISSEKYLEQFDEACAFLRGERPAYLKELADEMEEAAAKLEFERAASLRDTLFSLRATVKERSRVRVTPEMAAEAALSGLAKLKDVLQIEGELSVIEAFDISNISGTYAVASMVCAIKGMPHRNRYRRFKIKTVEGSNDPAMIGEVIQRRFAPVVDGEGVPAPDLVLVDGGMTQLNAARAELDKLGLSNVPAAGLAKKYEELYVCGRKTPIRLPIDSAALKLLQRVRDEAHRFALDYHHRLRRKRISESALDDIHGIGETRKLKLLRHFGSVHQLARASVEKIAEVDGIGPEMARTIYESLKKERR